MTPESNKPTHKNGNNKGFALIWALILTIVLMTLATTMALVATKDLRVTSNNDESQRAIHAAEAGMEFMLKTLNTNLTSNIDWCSSYNPPTVDLLNNTKYTAKMQCTQISPRIISIESEGISNGTTKRKLKSRIQSITNTDTDVFNYGTGFGTLGSGYFNPSSRVPAYSVPNKRTITQIFDIYGLKEITNSHYTTLGLKGAASNVGVKLTGDSSKLRMAFTGNINGTPLNESLDIVKGDIETDGYFRLKIEIASQGSSFTTVRATILRRDINSGNAYYTCENTSVGLGAGQAINTTIMQGVQAKLTPLNNIWAENLSFTTNSSTGDSYLGVIGDTDHIKVRSMTLYGKE